VSARRDAEFLCEEETGRGGSPGKPGESHTATEREGRPVIGRL